MKLKCTLGEATLQLCNFVSFLNFIGVSLSEPHINGYELCECDIYIYIYGTSVLSYASPNVHHSVYMLL